MRDGCNILDFDGFKLSVCIDTAWSWWDYHLAPHLWSWKNKPVDEDWAVNEVTRQFPNNTTLQAEYYGLKFKISTSNQGNTHATVSGSFAKYHNQGKHNAYQLNPKELKEVIEDLYQKFNIDPTKAILSNLETRVLLYTDYHNEIILNSLISIQNKNFREPPENDKTDLKYLEVSFTSWVLKVYQKTTSLLTFEIKYCNNRALKHYGINSLFDLLDESKKIDVITRIIEVWSLVRFCDGGMNWEAMTKRKRLAFADMRSPLFWLDSKNNSNPYGVMNHEKRKDADKRFRNAIKKYQTSTRHQDISNVFKEIYAILTAEKHPQKHRFSSLESYNSRSKTPPKTSSDKGRFLGELGVSDTPTNTNPKSPNSTTKKTDNLKGLKRRVCSCCKKEITHKSKRAKYCSKKCNNKMNGKKRTSKRQKERLTEKANLSKLQKVLNKKRLWFMVTYKANTEAYTDTLHQTEVSTSKEWIRSVQMIVITGYRKNSPPIILTSYRARRLIKEAVKRNKERDMQNSR